MSAPSFSSFPPSFASFPDLDVGPSKPQSTTQAKKRAKNDKKHEKKHEEKEKKHRRDLRDIMDEGDVDWYQAQEDERLKAEEDLQRRSGHSAGTSGTRSPPLFYSDRKGDPMNIRYGGLYAGDVPKYHLVNYGLKILGLGKPWTVHHRTGKGVEVGIGHRQKTSGLTDSKTRTLLAAPLTKRLLPSSDPHKYEETDGFIRIPSNRTRRDDQAYRSITADNPSSDSSSSEHGSSHRDSDTIPLTSYQETTKILEQQLLADASSITAWLSLLSHSLATIPVTSKNATKARSEISLSILSRALSAHPANASSVVLLLKHLRAGEEVWQETKLAAEWADALMIGGVELWMEWLEWRLRKGGNGITRAWEDGIRVLEALSGEVDKIRVLWRLAVALQNAGFVERATAIFQAQAELMFYMPPILLSQSYDAQLDSLEEYWESGFPHIGEADAKGWSDWISSGKPEYGVTAMDVAEEISEDPNTLDPYIRWSTLESRSDRSLRLPSRSADESDPYATILFSDIRPFLMPIRSERAKNVFRLAWLSFSGLHVPGFAGSLSADRRINADDRWCCAHLTSPPYLSTLLSLDVTQKRITSDACAGAIIGREKAYMSSFGPVKNWGYCTFHPLERLDDNRGGLWTQEDLQGVNVPFIRHVFAQLRLGADDPEWDLLTLAFEAAISIKSALKVSRSLLSTARDSALHWAAHARLERIRGRTDEARKIYQTVLVASRPTAEPGVNQLWWNWAELEWLSGQLDDALQVIARSAGIEGVGLAATLRARRSLQETLTGTPEVQWQDRETLIKRLALLERIVGSVDSADHVFAKYLHPLEHGSIEHESLTVAHLVLLHRDRAILKNAVPPSLWRVRVTDAQEAYPSNTVIVGMFLEGEKGQGIWGRVRGMLGESTTGDVAAEKDVARRVMEVWMAGWEKGRWENEKERTRSGLAAAVESERTRDSAIIWRLYIEFEIRIGELQLAKKMLFRAIGVCPLVKELYLLAFGPLRSVFSPVELNSFSDTMVERGLRMRRGLDEFLGGWVEKGEGRDESEDSEDDEVEHNARELRRLQPY